MKPDVGRPSVVPLGEILAKSRPNLPRCLFSAGKGAWPVASGRMSVELLVKLINVNFVMLT